MTGEPLIEGRNLHKNYGGVAALSDVSFSLNAGEVLGLVGPNGAGKTTLVDVITGVQAADRGRLSLAGKTLAGSSWHRGRLGLGRTFQYPQLAMELSVADNLHVGSSARRQSTTRALVASLLMGIVRLRPAEEVALAERVALELGLVDLDRRPSQLSLGQQRLVEVARAMCQDPSVLLLDEPFAGADDGGIEGISEAIRTVRDQGRAVILVDHNVDLVSTLADRILLLERGRVSFDGDPAACLSSPEMRRVYFGVIDEDVS